MKRILSLIIVVTVFLSMFSFNAFATEEAEAEAERLACYRIDWSTQSYYTYTYNEAKTNDNYVKYFNVDKTSRYIYTTGTTSYDGSAGGRAYFSQQMFDINNATHYEYFFKAKNNLNDEYAGIVFAFGSGLAYIMYGAFNNTAAAPNAGASAITLTRGLHASSSKDCSTGYESSFMRVALDKDGFGHYKIVYRGYEVSVYGLTDMEKGVYTKIGSSITLPGDAKIALGVYAMTETKGPNRTVNLSDCLLYAMNDQANQILSSCDDGSARLVNLIEEAKTNYNEVDNTGATYRELQRAVEAAETLLEGWSFTSTQLKEVEKNLEDALDQMEVNAADLTELRAAIASFETLNPLEYTELSYKMVEQAVAEGKELLTKESVRQSRVNYATKRILDRMFVLVPNGYVDYVEESETYVESESAVDNLEDLKSGCGGCGSSAAISAVALICGIGTALIVKKKED
ncbi:MAG: hypothetical protein E7678_02820 [Ruminococcaceae bacterium]|nr:hypothetical protein [Oscillospiraceae bacterium]